jgi:hypothetical protein
MPFRDLPPAVSYQTLRQYWRWMLLCGALAMLPAWALAAAAKERKVLVLYSLGADSASAWQSLIHKGLSAELAQQNLTSALGIFEERFDAVRVGDQQSQAGMEQYLRTKYANIRFDDIITENYVAARFLSEHPELFRGVPRHYLNHGRPNWKPDDGIAYDVQADFSRAIDTIARMAPDVRHVVIIGDSTDNIQESVNALRKVAAGYNSRLSFEYWDKLSYEQIDRQAAQLQPGSAIFLLAFYHDSTGERRRPVETARKLVAATQVPIFTNWEAIVIPGVVGGYVISAERIGHAIGKLLIQQTPDIAGITGYLFDYAAVQRFHLQNVPSGALWLNRPQSMLQQYLWQILGGVTLIVVEGILISALIVALRGRRQSLRALHDERNQLEARVLQRTLELMVANTKLEQLATTDPDRHRQPPPHDGADRQGAGTQPALPASAVVADGRYRPLQERQRRLWPRGGRPRDRGGVEGAGRRHAQHRHGLALRRRGIRAADAGNRPECRRPRRRTPARVRRRAAHPWRQWRADRAHHQHRRRGVRSRRRAGQPLLAAVAGGQGAVSGQARRPRPGGVRLISGGPWQPSAPKCKYELLSFVLTFNF